MSTNDIHSDATQTQQLSQQNTGLGDAFTNKPIDDTGSRRTTNESDQNTIPHNQWVGNASTEEKPSKTLRIAFQNLNGLGTHQCKNQISLLANEQVTLDIDILCMSEHCLNIKHQDTLKNLQQTIRSTTVEKTSFQINSSDSPTTQRYLPGGTAILLIGHTVGRIEPDGRGGDPMGRWSYVHLRRKKMKPVTIVTIYQVVKQPTNTTGNTAWHQQRLALDAQNRHDTHPRTAFINDLIQFIDTLREQNHDIIIGGDFNDTVQRHNSGILKLIMHTGLVDIWQHNHPEHPTFNTYSRGTERIDTVLCTTNILSCIKHIGYSPFQWLTNSDHRAILLDIDFHTLLNDNNPAPALDPSTRRIRSNDLPMCRIFVDQFHKHLMANNAPEQLNAICQDIATHADLERFDKLIGQAGNSAEAHCKRRRPEYYSVTLHQLRIKKSIVQCHYRNVRQHQTQQISVLQHRLARANINLQLPTEATAVKELLSTIGQELKTAIENSFELREKELSDKINKKHEPGSETYVNRLRAIKKNEATRRAWQTLKFLRTGTSTQQALNRIDIPDTWPPPNEQNIPNNIQDPKTCTTWRTITNPTDIDHYIRMRNRGHFSQAHGTPFTEIPLTTDINWAADTVTADDILCGHSQIESIQSIPQCQALLDACRAVTELNALPAEITTQEFKAKMRSWRKLTTTSPSGRHLGRYKALIPNLDVHDDTSGHLEPIYKQKQEFIIQTIVAILNYCIRNNYTPQRWKTIINTMIFKESGNYKIHRLRVIHIYEADFNLLLAVKWRQLLQYANLQGNINDGLFGGRPGCEAQSLVFLEELKYDTSYCSRRTLFNFDNDATSCYDRIIIALASIINRKYGMHQRLVALHANTLQQARFHLRTVNGISSDSYSHCIQFPIYGSGQGSGNSPAIWLFISSTLCDIHNQISHGATFTNPQGTETVKLSMVAFVDDSTGTYNDFQPQSQSAVHTMLPHAQSDCQSWNDLLWCSGGKLELPKCSYHVLRFEFLPNGIPRAKKSADDLQLQVKDAETGNLISIPSKQADDPHKTLGHWKSPIASSKSKQLAVLKTKARDLAILIGTGALTRHGADLAYHAVYCASLKYVLPQCFFLPRTLDQAEAQSLPIILAKQGYNRNTAKPIRFCPKSSGGCGLIPWKVLQGEGQVNLFIKHWRTNTVISQMLRMTLAWAQWNAGISEPILNAPTIPLPHLEARWISSLRQSLTDAQMNILHDTQYTVTPEREGDQHLMNWIINKGCYDSIQIHILNCCRLHLNVTTISELFDEYGKNIQPHMFNCTKPKWFNTTQVIAIQTRPSHHQIRTLWKPMCKLLHQEVAAQRIRFTTWTHDTTSTRPHRSSYVDTNTQPHTYYHWIQDAYWTLLPYYQQSQSSFMADQATSWKPHPAAIPIILAKERITIHGIVYRFHPTNTRRHDGTIPALGRTNTYKDFHSSIATLYDWQRQILQATKFHIPEEQVRHRADDPSHSWTIITDHHFLNEKTCFSWLLFQHDGEILASGSGPCPGPPERTRADAWSLLASIQFVNHHWDKPTATEPQPNLNITFLNRNQRIIKRIRDLQQYTTIFCNITLDRDWDLIKQTADTASHPKFWNARWEPLHHFLDSQRSHDIRRLPILTQRILDTKAIAKTTLQELPPHQHHSPFLPSSKCMLTHEISTIHGRYLTAYREAATLPNLMQYLKRKHTWTDDTPTSVHWTWFKTAVRRSHEASKVTISKLIYNQLATQTRKATTGGAAWVVQQCPHCPETPETFQHLLRCKHPAAATFRTNILAAIPIICSQRRAPTILRDILHSWIAEWLQFRTPNRQEIDPRLIPL